MTMQTSGAPEAGRGDTARGRGPQDIAAGLFLVAVAAFALWQSADLPLGTLRSMGPGMLPRSLAVICAGLGIVIAAQAMVTEGPALERWHWRGPLFILGAVAVFALTIRTAGLAIAGPATMMVASMAADDVEWKEAAIFSVCMTAACILLFKTLLGLPIPVLTFL